MPLNLYTSTRMEVLVDTLKATLQEPLASPFKKKVIVVQSRGMERWLSMKRIVLVQTSRDVQQLTPLIVVI